MYVIDWGLCLCCVRICVCIAEVKNKFRTLTQGKTSEKVVGLMANTFKALVDYAEWGPEQKSCCQER